MAEEKLVLEFSNVRHKKQDGVLLLTSLRVAWAPGEIVQTFQADYPYPQIKGKQSYCMSPEFRNNRLEAPLLEFAFLDCCALIADMPAMSIFVRYFVSPSRIE